MNRLTPLGILAGAGLLLAAAAGSPGWTATLMPTAGSTVSGEASIEAAQAPEPMPANPDSAKAMMSHHAYTASAAVKGADAGATLAWFVHTGTCSSPTGLFGGADAYPVIKTDANGAGSATATVMGMFDAGHDYSVAVHSTNMEGPVVACGNLRTATTP